MVLQLLGEASDRVDDRVVLVADEKVACRPPVAHHFDLAVRLVWPHSLDVSIWCDQDLVVRVLRELTDHEDVAVVERLLVPERSAVVVIIALTESPYGPNQLGTFDGTGEIDGDDRERFAHVAAFFLLLDGATSTEDRHFSSRCNHYITYIK